MSIALPNIDLTSAGVGTRGKILFSSVGISAGGVSSNPAFLQNRPHIRLANNSGCGLFIEFITEGHTDHLDAGAWRSYDLVPGESGIMYTVEYVMPNPPISLLSPTYYFPNETVDEIGILGNSPIGGTAATSSVQTLSNEGNAGTTLVIDVGDATFAQLFELFASGRTIWKVDQSGVAHQVIAINTTGNPLQFGQTGDITEVLGQLNVDQTLQIPNNVAFQSKDSGGTARNILQNDASNNVRLQAAGNNQILLVDNGGTSRNIFNLLSPFTTTLAGDVNIAGKSTVVSGSSGSCTFYTPIWGAGLKVLIIVLDSNYTKASATTFTLPSAMSHCVGILGGFDNQLQPKSGGSNVNPFAITVLGGAGAGTVAGPLTGGWKQGTLGVLDSSWDNLSLGNQTSQNGTMIFIGI